MNKPTQRQLEVLAAIHKRIAANGYSPSLRELLSDLGIASTNGINQHIDALVRHGLVTQVHGQMRTVRLTKEGEEVIARYRADGNMATAPRQFPRDREVAKGGGGHNPRSVSPRAITAPRE